MSSPELLPKISLVGVDAAMTCNLSCAYCSAHREFQRCKDQPMQSLSNIRKLFGQLRELQLRQLFPLPSFVWFGGEPLLLGKEVFREIIALQAEVFGNSPPAYNQLNSNATLLDHEWIEFFEEAGVDLIVSIDGPPSLNGYRRRKDGSAAHAHIMRGIELVKKSSAPLKYIGVITQKNYREAKCLYEFAREQGAATIDYLPCFDSKNLSNLENDQYARFMIDMYEAWRRDPDEDKPRITTLASIVEAIGEGTTSCCTLMQNCGGRFYMDVQGYIRYCCNLFYDSRVTVLGHVDAIDLGEEMREGSRLAKLRKQVLELQAACRHCPVFPVCGGGCTTQRQESENVIYGLTAFCGGRYSLIRHIMLDMAEETPELERRFALHAMPDAPPCDITPNCACGAGVS